MADGLIQWFNDKLKEGDERIKDWPLMDLRVVFGWIAFYLIGIFVTVQIMKSPERKPFKLKWIALLHNAHLCLLSLYMCVEVLRQAYLAGYSLFGNGVDRTEKGLPMARIIWIFYASKIVEFGDTFIMALKKNFHQISFLHLYHHTSIFFIWWVVTYFAPGGESYFSAALNSFIHVLMYGYYFWSTVDGWSVDKNAAKAAAASAAATGKKVKLTPCQPAYWRQSITTMQMTQFSCMFIQACFNVIVDIPGYPRFLGWVLFFYMLTMLGLFANFFIRAYSKPKGAKKDPAAAAATGDAAKKDE